MLFCPLRITTNQVSASIRNHSNLYQRFVPIFVLVEWVQFHRDIRFESILRSCWSGRDIFWHITTMASKEWISVAQFHTRGFRPSMGQEFVPVEREENRGSMFFFWGILFMNVHQKAGLASPHLPVAGADLCGTKYDETCNFGLVL